MPAAAAFALAACDGAKTADASASGMASRLQAGDTSVCADSLVQQTFVKQLIGDDAFHNFLANGNKVPSFNTEGGNSANGQSGVVFCSPTVSMGTGLMGDRSIAVEFDVRPSPDDRAAFVVDVPSANEGNGVLADWLSTKAVRPGQAQSPNAPVPDDVRNPAEPADQEPAQSSAPEAY